MRSLHSRSFLKELDFTADELRFLLTLPQALKTAKYEGTEVPRLTGTEIALVVEMPDGLEVTDGVFEFIGQRGVRPSREPAPHHQGHPGRHRWLSRWASPQSPT
jgi:hypothetical protein